MIAFENVSYNYKQSDAPALKSFSASFNKGEIVAVSGKNGSGKTTMTKLLVGILRPDQGFIYIDGLDSVNMDLFEIGRRVGYVFQNPDRQLFCESVIDEITFGLKNLGLDKERASEVAERYLDYFGLSHHRNDFPFKLSGGERQKLALASVVALGTDYIVLDEPTTGLDMRSRCALGVILRRLKSESGCGIIFVSHERDFIERWADRELVMET